MRDRDSPAAAGLSLSRIGDYRPGGISTVSIMYTVALAV